MRGHLPCLTKLKISEVTFKSRYISSHLETIYTCRDVAIQLILYRSNFQELYRDN